ncbi:AI-2E family transporter [Caldicellulosiruptoraceae bacterium PP1]
MFSKKNIDLKLLISILFVIFILFIIITNLHELWSIIIPIIISIFLAYLIKPMVDFMNLFIKNKSISIMFIFTIFLTLIIIFFIYFIPILIDQIKQLIITIPYIINTINNWIIKANTSFFNQFNIDINNILIKNQVKIENIFNQMLNKILNIIQYSYGNLFYYIIIPILVYYFIKDWDEIAKWFKWLLPKSYRKDGIKIISDINLVMNQYIRAQLVDALIIGIIITIGLIIFDIKFALILGIIAGLSNMIPYFGPIIGMIPAFIVALPDSLLKGILVIIFYFVVQQIDSLFISPRLIGSRLGLHPITVIITLMICGKLFGIFSMFFAIPIITVFKKLVIEIYSKFIKKE